MAAEGRGLGPSQTVSKIDKNCSTIVYRASLRVHDGCAAESPGGIVTLEFSMPEFTAAGARSTTLLDGVRQ
jgi:hypothetical protein